MQRSNDEKSINKDIKDIIDFICYIPCLIWNTHFLK